MIYGLLIFASLWNLPGEYSSLHAIYVSVVEISFNTSSSEAKIQVKMFTDDFEDAIQNQTGTRVKLTKHCDKYQDLMAGYLRDHLEISVNEDKIDYRITDCENVDISTWVEFTFASDDKWNKIEIKGDQLMELFPTQSNVFSVTYNEQKRMFRLTNSKKSTALEFD